MGVEDVLKGFADPVSAELAPPSGDVQIRSDQISGARYRRVEIDDPSTSIWNGFAVGASCGGYPNDPGFLTDLT
jgi:hypothetical protein